MCVPEGVRRIHFSVDILRVNSQYKDFTKDTVIEVLVELKWKVGGIVSAAKVKARVSFTRQREP